MTRKHQYRPLPTLAPRPALVFPCLPGGANAYVGCVGVGRCQQQGTERCLFSRWATLPHRSRLDPLD